MTTTPRKSKTIAAKKLAASRMESLLSDPDDCIASLAMEQLLKESDCQKLISENQDSEDELMRRRIHELSVITRDRQLRTKMIYDFEQGRLNAWDYLMLIDKLYDTRSSKRFLNDLAEVFFDEFTPQGRADLQQIADYMQLNSFSVPRPPWLNTSLFLLGDVLENCLAVPEVLCIIARELAKRHGLRLFICMQNGDYCLMDSQQRVVFPTRGWKVCILDKKSPGGNISPSMPGFTNQDLIRLYTAQLLATSVANWDNFDTKRFGKILQEFDHINSNPLPYPYGDFDAPHSTTPED